MFVVRLDTTNKEVEQLKQKGFLPQDNMAVENMGLAL